MRVALYARVSTESQQARGTIGSQLAVLRFISEYGLKARPVATGDSAGTITQVMSGQVDVGWAVAPFVLDLLNKGEARMIARASDIAAIRGHCFGGGLELALAVVAQDLLDHLVLGLEVVVEAAREDPGLVGDVAHRRAEDALAGEDGGGDGQDLVPAGRRGRPGLRARRRARCVHRHRGGSVLAGPPGSPTVHEQVLGCVRTPGRAIVYGVAQATGSPRGKEQRCRRQSPAGRRRERRSRTSC